MGAARVAEWRAIYMKTLYDIYPEWVCDNIKKENMMQKVIYNEWKLKINKVKS